MNVGDRVELVAPHSAKHPGVWTVVKVNSVNLSLEQGGRRLRCHPSFVTKVDISPQLTEVLLADLPPHFDAGELVRYKGAVYVVIKDATPRVHIAKLGGDQGRYWRVPPTLLTRITHFTLTEETS